ncbi:MAG: phage tail protein [Desulfuromonas sp.]|nr:phage tail protein [Desulfuromonas sp.]
MNEYYTLITTIGQAKLAAAAASEDSINLADIAVGDGNYTPSVGQTSLVSEKWRASLSTVQTDAVNPGRVIAEGVVPPEAGGWYIREVGLLDADGDLFAIAKFPETYKPVLESGSAKDLFLRLYLDIGSAAAVTLSVDPSLVLATREYVGEQTNPLAVGVQEALARTAQNQKAIDEVRKCVFAQGTTHIKNKHVVKGFVLTKADVRYLHLSETGTVGSGESIARIDGGYAKLVDDGLEVAVPENLGTEAITRYAYLADLGAGEYGVLLGETVPDAAMLLYTATIPAGNTGNDISAVTLTDNRVINDPQSWLTTASPSAYVPLEYPLPSGQDYDVLLTVESATDRAAVGDLYPYDKQDNGFKVGFSGTADNVLVRYTVAAINRD